MSEEKALKEKYKNPMLKPQLEKVTVNISVGRSGLPLENAVKILEALTGQKPCKRKAKKTIRDFGIRKGEPMACMVTLRGDKAVNFLKIAFQAIGDRLLKKSFDNQGNFSFGIKEHIEIPGVKYFPKLGIYGMDVSATLGRLGYRVKRRHRAKSKIGLKHVLKRDEAITFLKEEFGVQITG